MSVNLGQVFQGIISMLNQLLPTLIQLMILVLVISVVVGAAAPPKAKKAVEAEKGG